MFRTNINNTDRAIINKTDIIFDIQFKDFIKKLQMIMIKEWSHLFHIKSCDSLDHMHQWIQEYVFDNRKQINLNVKIDVKNKSNTKVSDDKRAVNMPNLYAINVCLLLDIDKYSSFKEIEIPEKFVDYSNYSDEYNLCTWRCACGHTVIPQNISYLSSSSNIIKIQLGDFCILKTGISSRTLKKIKKDKIEKDKQQSDKIKYNRRSLIIQFQGNLKRVKQQFEKIKSNKNKVFEQLNHHFETIQNNRRCAVCNKYNILTTEPIWKKKCLECYYNTRVPKKKDFQINSDKITFSKASGKFISNPVSSCMDIRGFFSGKT